MKKIFILSISLFLSACACMNSDEPQETEIVYRNTQSVQDCDYFDGQTCYRYRNGSSRYSYGSREVVRYREPRTYVVAERNSYRNASYAEPRRTYEVASRSSSCSASSAAVVETGDNAPCKTTIRETREPVEVVYKKTTYRTVYEPKTYEDVSYEKEPYTGYKREGCADCL